MSGSLAGLPPAMTKAEKKAASASQASQSVPHSVSSSASPSQYALMVADPLYGPLVGRPDAFSAATNVMRIKDVYDIIADSNGNAVYSCGGSPSNNYPGVVATTTPYGVTAGTPANSQYRAQIELDNYVGRVLGLVVQWKPTLAVNVMQGKGIMAPYNTGGIVPKGIQSYFNDNGVNFSAGTEAVMIARHWTEPIYNAISIPGVQWPNIQLTLVGMPVGQLCGQIIVTRILECVPNQGVLAAEGATITPCNTMDCCIANNISGMKASMGSGPMSYATAASHGLKIAKTAAKIFGGPAAGALVGLAEAINAGIGG
jgi:hypothetical protein